MIALLALLALPAVLALLALLALLASLALLALLAFLALLACLLALLACLLPVGMVLARWLPLGSLWRLHGMPFGLHCSCLGWSWTSFWRPWGYPGHGLCPGLARGPQNGLDCIEAQAGALFYQDPGIEITAQVEGEFEFSGPYYQSNNCLIQGTFISELVYAGLRKVTVELFDWTAPPQPGGTLFEGPADIYIYILSYLVQRVDLRAY